MRALSSHGGAFHENLVNLIESCESIMLGPLVTIVFYFFDRTRDVPMINLVNRHVSGTCRFRKLLEKPGPVRSGLHINTLKVYFKMRVRL